MLRLHTLLLYPHKTQASLYRHAWWTHNVVNPCSTYKDKGTRYMHWASPTTHILVPSKPCRNTSPAECFPINKSTLAAQGQYLILAKPILTCSLTFPESANPRALDEFAFPPAHKLPVPPASHSQHTSRIHRHPILLDPYHPIGQSQTVNSIRLLLITILSQEQNE